MTTYFNVTVLSEWCALAVAIGALDKKTGNWRLFITWLSLSLCTETIGWYLHNFKGMIPNALPFNILMILRSLFLISFFSSHSGRFLPLFKSFLVIFIIGAVLNLLFFQGFWQYNFYSESLADLMLIILCCRHLLALVTQPEYINLLSSEYFWLSIGLLFYSMGSAFLYNFYNLLAEYRRETGVNVGLYLNYGLNILLSSCLIIAFICRRKTTRSLPG